jgi:hypothetical protein
MLRGQSRRDTYALLQKPEATELGDLELEEIGTIAQNIAEIEAHFIQSPPRPDPTDSKWRKQVQNMWRRLYGVNIQRQVSVMRELGITTIWCRHSEIPDIVDQIIRRDG